MQLFVPQEMAVPRMALCCWPRPHLPLLRRCSPPSPAPTFLFYLSPWVWCPNQTAAFPAYRVCISAKPRPYVPILPQPVGLVPKSDSCVSSIPGMYLRQATPLRSYSTSARGSGAQIRRMRLEYPRYDSPPSPAPTFLFYLSPWVWCTNQTAAFPAYHQATPLRSYSATARGTGAQIRRLRFEHTRYVSPSSHAPTFLFYLSPWVWCQTPTVASRVSQVCFTTKPRPYVPILPQPVGLVPK